MRISPKSLSPAEAIAKAKANASTKDVERREAAAREAAEAEAAPKTSPAEIDANRAQQLLKRAATLAERGDMGAAVLATRQSLALAPNNVDGHLQLAGLLERARDFGGARAAYEKSVQIAPDRTEARDNLERINVYLAKSQNAAGQFQFDAEELFPAGQNALPTLISPANPDGAAGGASADFSNGSSGENAPSNAEPVASEPVLARPATSPIVAPSESSADFGGMEMFDESMLPSIEARLPPSRAEEVAEKQAPIFASSEIAAQTESVGRSPIETPAERGAPANSVGDRRKNNVPVASERRRRPSKVAAPVPTAMAPAAPRPPQAASVAAGASSAMASAGVATALASPVPLRPQRATDAFFDISTPASSLAAPVAARSLAVPLDLDIPPAPVAPLWQQVIARPSFYARTLPLVGVALLGLGFLSWSRGLAVSQLTNPASTQLAQADPAFVPDESPQFTGGVPDTASLAPDGGASVGSPAVQNTNASGFPISNAPAVFQAPPAANSAPANSASAQGNLGTNSAPANNRAPARNSAPSTTARANNRGGNGTSSSRPRLPIRVLPPARPVPRFPSVSLAPAPIPQSILRPSAPNAGNNNSRGGSSIILPSPNIDFSAAPAPRTRVLPPSDNGLNPAGSPGRGYARVTEGRVGNGVIPVQPSGAARDSERQANDAARQGQTDQAIEQLSQAIRADSDNAGFRYQQRATLFLQRGDYSRASDDFQSAISAYQGQISRGDDVSQARRGLASARSGLNLAITGKRG